MMNAEANLDIYQLSDHQQWILMILPIPSALLSVAGSSLILLAVRRSRKQRKLTPYGRLLFAMSFYNVQSSITYATAPFLRPRDTSNIIWSFGNNATCTAVGFFNQVSLSNMFFVFMLCCYFLLAVRFGYSNEQLSKRVEPWMHLTAICYPLFTATIALSQGWYGKVTNGLGCWLSRYPTHCGDKEGQTGETCISEGVIWMFYLIPSIIALGCLVIIGIAMFDYVWKQSQRTRRNMFSKGLATRTVTQHAAAEPAVKQNDEEYGEDYSESMVSLEQVDAAERISQQNERLKMLASQAFLYVLSYALCNFATAFMILLESTTGTEKEEAEMITAFFPVAVMQAIFHPLQGILNYCIFIRPKYVKYRYDNASESRSATPRPPLVGLDSSPEEAATQTKKLSKSRQVAKVPGKNDVISETATSSDEHQTEFKETPKGPRSSMRPLPRDMVSSLTASSEENEDAFCSFVTNKTKQKRKKHTPVARREPTKQSYRSLRASELEMISELSESIFEPMVAGGGGERRDQPKNLDQSSRESPWGPNQGRTPSEKSPSLTMKIPLAELHRVSEADLDLSWECRWDSGGGKRSADISLIPSPPKILRRILSDTSSFSPCKSSENTLDELELADTTKSSGSASTPLSSGANDELRDTWSIPARREQ